MNGVRKSRVEQLNLLAYLMQMSEGNSPDRLEAVLIFRDWSQTMTERKSGDGYPQRQVMRVPIENWGLERQGKFLRERVEMHQAAQSSSKSHDRILCTDEDRWSKPDQWAVMKTGRKSAVRLYDSQEDADRDAFALGAKHYVEYRPGENVRCKRYCNVAQFCEQKKSSMVPCLV
jgi:hypothetical protein